MPNQPVTIARIYVREGEHSMRDILRILHDDQRVAGLTVLRGVTGFAHGGTLHPASLVDLSLDLPLVIEFYDRTERVEAALAALQMQMSLPHIVSWAATLHLPDG